MGQSARESATRAFVSVPSLVMSQRLEMHAQSIQDSRSWFLSALRGDAARNRCVWGCFGKLVGSSIGEVLEEALRGAGLLRKTVSGTRFHANFTQKSHVIFLGGGCSKTWCLIALGTHAVLISWGSPDMPQRCLGRGPCRAFFEARPGDSHHP